MLGCGFLLGLLAWQPHPAAAQFITRVYVVTEPVDSVSVFDHDTAAGLVQPVGNPISVGEAPMGIAITPDHSHVYVTNESSDSVSLLFGPTISVEREPVGIAITPDGAYAYVTNRGSNTVWKIATATNQMVGRVILPSGSYPTSIAITPDGSHAYVTNRGSNSVSVIDAGFFGSNQLVRDPIPVGSSPDSIAITPDGAFAYVPNARSNNVSVIRTADNQVVGDAIPVQLPQAIAIAPDGTYAYVASLGFIDNPNKVVLINTTSNRVEGQPIAVGVGPRAIATFSYPKHIIWFRFEIVKEITFIPIYPLMSLPGSFTMAVTDAALVATVTWDFYGDGSVVATTATLSTPFTYTRAGTFTPRVTVALTDGSHATATTTLRVQSPTEGIDTLHALVDWLELDAGRTTSLVSKLTAAQDAITRGNEQAACNQVQAFEHEVEALVHSGHLDQESAAPRLSQAQAIQGSLGCS
jgi:YVTN family beta-propeller protein